ncbi:MAG: O-methyltransferase [Planctomycetota bacterium]
MKIDTDSAIARHLEDIAPADDEFFESMRAAALEAGIPSISIDKAQASMIQAALRAIGAKEVVEVGTLFGGTALRMARALPEDGRVRTFEIESKHADFAEHWIARSDAAGKVEVHRGDARETLPRVPDASIDAMFIDADKVGYETYIAEAARVLRDHGLLLVDNAFAFGDLLDESCTDESVLAIRAVNDNLRQNPLFEGSIVPLGDGFWFCTRVARA